MPVVAETYRQQPEIRSRLQVVQTEQEQPPTALRSKDRSVWGSEAFNVNYDAQPTKEELRADIVSYLSEYRLQVQKYDYELFFGHDKDKRGPIKLRDKDRNESMLLKAKRSIEERNLKGEPVHREEAEEKGLRSLEDQLRKAQTGDTVVWASPPGPKEQGYGEHGFIYKGTVTRYNSGEAHLAMTAIRLEKPTLQQYNTALQAITGEEVTYMNPEAFLARPRVVQEKIADKEFDGRLKEHFNFEPDAKQQKKNAVIIEEMGSMITDFVTNWDTFSTAHKIKGLHSLENYAEKRKKDYEREEDEHVYMHYDKPRYLDDIMDDYGYGPRSVNGSCGSSGGQRSNGLMSAGRGEISSDVGGGAGVDRYGSREFECPSCDRRNTRPQNQLLTNCQFCGSDEVAC